MINIASAMVFPGSSKYKIMNIKGDENNEYETNVTCRDTLPVGTLYDVRVTRGGHGLRDGSGTREYKFVTDHERL